MTKHELRKLREECLAEVKQTYYNYRLTKKEDYGIRLSDGFSNYQNLREYVAVEFCKKSHRKL